MPIAFSVVAPIIAIIALGYMAARRDVFSQDHVATLNRFVFVLAAPALLFRNVALTEFPETLSIGLWLAYYAPMLVIMALAFIAARFVFGGARRLGICDFRFRCGLFQYGDAGHSHHSHRFRTGCRPAAISHPRFSRPIGFYHCLNLSGSGDQCRFTARRFTAQAGRGDARPSRCHGAGRGGDLGILPVSVWPCRLTDFLNYWAAPPFRWP